MLHAFVVCDMTTALLSQIHFVCSHTSSTCTLNSQSFKMCQLPQHLYYLGFWLRVIGMAHTRYMVSMLFNCHLVHYWMTSRSQCLYVISSILKCASFISIISHTTRHSIQIDPPTLIVMDINYLLLSWRPSYRKDHQCLSFCLFKTMIMWLLLQVCLVSYSTSTQKPCMLSKRCTPRMEM